MERPRYGEGYAIIDLRTGDIVDTAEIGEHFIAAKEGDHIYSQAQVDYNERKKRLQKNFMRKENFHKMFDKSKALADKMFIEEGKLKAYAIMNSLEQYIFFDGSIRIKGKFATVTDLAKLYKVSRQSMSEIISQLIKDEVLAKCETGDEFDDGTGRKYCLLYNPYISVRSRDVPVFLIDLFHDSKWNIYDNEAEDQKAQD